MDNRMLPMVYAACPLAQRREPGSIEALRARGLGHRLRRTSRDELSAAAASGAIARAIINQPALLLSRRTDWRPLIPHHPRKVPATSITAMIKV